ncbi:MAG: hypothetical protein EZS28_003257 [Streblomastix strix]|uniref:USP domain-containing protein n=1 Tax=Streblomastix strix TaxID=222440 RepID=A0A5J4X2H6_9EUKA|nr:MAG: hypothetical protein EZS28_003257 [Streblomastix strix]
MGMAATGVFCTGCRTARCTHQPFSILSLTIPPFSAQTQQQQQQSITSQTNQIQDPKNIKDIYSETAPVYSNSNKKKVQQIKSGRFREVSLYELLKHFHEMNDISSGIDCDICKKAQKAKHFLFISHWPDVLFLQINRFSDNGYGVEKDFTSIHIPELLERRQIIAHCFRQQPMASAQDTLAPPHDYVLTAAIFHSGSMIGGHYTCYGRLLDGSWVHHSDSFTTRSHPPPTPSSEAYCLITRFKLRTSYYFCYTQVRAFPKCEG